MFFGVVEHPGVAKTVRAGGAARQRHGTSLSPVMGPAGTARGSSTSGHHVVRVALEGSGDVEPWAGFCDGQGDGAGDDRRVAVQRELVRLPTHRTSASAAESGADPVPFASGDEGTHGDDGAVSERVKAP